MMCLISSLWLKMATWFVPMQLLFNGNFWETFRDKFGDFERKKVLDLACGTGDLRGYINPGEYLGLDINISYLNYARKRYHSKENEFRVQDVLKYQPEKKFDMTFLVGSSHHLSDTQLRMLFATLKKSKIENFIIADGYPIGVFAPILKWLDDVLGGGKYFRDLDSLSSLLKEYFVIKEAGILYAKRSFYKYPYIIVSSSK